MLRTLRCRIAGVAEALPADDVERKVALVLEHGLRPDRSAAEAFVVAFGLKCLALADYQQRIETLRMFGRTLAGLPVQAFRSGVKTTLVPRLTFVSEHACAFSLCVLRAPVEACIVPYHWRAPSARRDRSAVDR